MGQLGVDRAIDQFLAFARTDPTVAVAAAIGIVALLVAGWLLFRWYRRPTARGLTQVLESAEEVTVLMHPNPDPDAMGAAIGVAHLADRVDTEAFIQYPGEIRHQENRSFRTVLDLDLERIESAEDIASDRVVLVDHNEPRGFDGAERIRPVAVIDHHPGSGDGTRFTDVRPEYGAASTILAEYLDSLGFEPGDPTDGEPIPPEIASGLLYGILADTSHLTNGASPAEFEASAYLSPGIDSDLLDRIANPQVDAETLDVKARAITGREVKNPFAMSHVGDLSNVDAIPQAADELLHLEGVTAVVVSGRKDGTLFLSGRSRDDRVHMGRILEHVLGDIPMASGGGHARMGGGQASIDHMEGIGPSDGVSMDELHDRLFTAMAGEV
ncbi:nanoRNase/pAp phosphatase [Halanaeroarchaeum sp. HSR-CO]|nr:nanoRNase/pAp phosphatase [Halanaeroarchaeum sp. HSR-CO]